jgi:hypothetical protein
MVHYRDYVEEWEDPSSTQNFTHQYTFSVRRQGSDSPEDDFLLTSLGHITVAASGEVTAVVDKFEAECT